MGPTLYRLKWGMSSTTFLERKKRAKRELEMGCLEDMEQERSRGSPC
jgi:hypothetical protein